MVLGRGLNALLGDEETRRAYTPPAVQETPQKEAGQVFREIPIGQIKTNPFQPRADFQEEALVALAESIRVHGVIQPLTVRRLSDRQYQLIAGERRLRACRRAGLSSVPAFVRAADDQGLLEMALIENIQREDLNAIEIALSFQRLVSDCQLTQEEVGKRVGKERSTVTNYLRLLALPPAIQSALKHKALSMGHAKAIGSLQDRVAQLALFKELTDKRLSVRQAEHLARQYQKARPRVGEAARVRERHPAEGKLSSHYGTKVQVREGKEGAGEIRIPFYSREDFFRLLELMMP